MLLLCGKWWAVDQSNNQQRKASHISVKVRDILELHTFKYCCEQERPKGVSAPKRWLMNSFGSHLRVPFPVPVAWWTVGKSTPVVSLASWYLGLLSQPAAAEVLCFQIWEFYNEAEQLQFSLHSGNEWLCVPCHPVLIWALMYFINKGLLSSLTVVTPWFQCRMHAVRGYTINNQLAAITPF